MATILRPVRAKEAIIVMRAERGEEAFGLLYREERENG